MTLFSALTVAVGGLNAQSRAIGNISDNLSNTSTIGFKRIDTRFESLVTQSNNRLNDPGGVVATPAYQNSIQGNLLQSSSNTSLSVSGSGFFAVRAPEVDAQGAVSFGNEDLFTRRGDFTLDRNGFLVNGAGYFLSGYAVDTSGNVDTSQAEPVQISALLDNPVETGRVTYSANLPAGTATATAFPSSTILIFDALGQEHDLSFTWEKLSGSNVWELTIEVPDSTPAVNDTITFTFNDTTNPGTIDALNLPGGSPFSVIPPTLPDNFVDVSLTLNFTGAGSQPMVLNFGSYDVSSGVTQFADTDLQVVSFEQDGIPRGSFQDLTVDENGFIALNYDNGRSRTFYQIPVVQFFAPDLLQRLDGGAFSRTVESGSPRFSSAGTVGAGNIVSNSLEGSNVDIADEFTKMIQAQRIYSANARTITTTNSMLDEVINIVR